MGDIAALKAALDEAETAEQALIEERRQNRDAMTKAQFRAYNQETRAQQVELASNVAKAREELAFALNDVRSEALNVAVGTISESDSVGGANG